ncbi:MAG: DNA mismatch repair protein MutS [Peptococcaceae bacterium]|nr:DNA mismatch repair protein MutS [Peptococcaceae bacterium]
MAAVTPMMRQYTDIKKQHPDAILFFRLGDFYEMFDEDAIVASKELEITLTGRAGGEETKIPMCGVPYHAADVYISKLIAKGYKVAICEQMEDPKLAKGIVKREVIRVITPGTVMETNMLNELNQNYLLAVYKLKNTYGIAYTDISTGEFLTTEITGDDSLQKMVNEVCRISPAECILPKSLINEDVFQLGLLGSHIKVLTPMAYESQTVRNAAVLVATHFRVANVEALGLRSMPAATIAVAAVLDFLAATQKQEFQYLNKIQIYNLETFMVLDATTRRNLELTATLRQNQRRGSLLWVLDKTCTSPGARLLKQWIEKPLIDAMHINMRLQGVQELIEKPFLHDDLIQALNEMYDLERLCGRVCYGNASPLDMIALKNSIRLLPHIINVLMQLEKPIFQRFYDRIDALEDIEQLIEKAIDDAPPLSPKDGGVIKKGYYPQVDELREIASTGKAWLAALEAKLKEETGIKSLKTGYNKVFGYYIEVTKTNLDLVPDYFIRRQTLANAERFVTEELKDWENKILGANEKLTALEYDIFLEIRKVVADNADRLQNTAHALAALDVIQSFAKVAVENNYCCPEVNDGEEIMLTASRHSVVEKIIGRENYIDNDVMLDNENTQLLLITGPNMAGKSTYMRQVALCVLMARIGSFVPAEKAVIGKVDRIFTRVGASDDLSAGQSTFMVEMSETANILRNATRNSLVILDEIGRGTSTYDGLSIAWAVAEYLLKPELKAKTMFATHYHELTQLADDYPAVKNCSVAVKEKDGGIIFLRKIVPGGADKSYGIQVAKLAGLPKEVIIRASEVLLQLEAAKPTHELAQGIAPPKHIVVETVPKDVLSFLAETGLLDASTITPIQAMFELDRLQKKAKALKDQYRDEY